MYVTKNNTPITTASNGTNGFKILSNDILAIPHAVKRHIPTGGVISPIVRFNTIITPKCNVSIPNSLTITKKIGVRIIRFDVGSSIQPIINITISTSVIPNICY